MSEHKIPVFDLGGTFVPEEDEINQTVKKKLNQQGISEVPHFSPGEYNIYDPEEVQEWLDEHGIETDAERISLAYKGRNKRYFQRKSYLDLLKQLGDERGPVGFVADNAVEAKEFYQNLFEMGDEEEPINYEGFVVPEEIDEDELNEKVFKEFLERREESAERFIYFSNNPDLEETVEELGMDFVLVKQHDVDSEDYEGLAIYRLEYRNFEKVLD